MADVEETAARIERKLDDYLRTRGLVADVKRKNVVDLRGGGPPALPESAGNRAVGTLAGDDR